MSDFSSHIRNVYAGMVRRTSERRFKSGRNKGKIRKHGIPIPFKAKQLESFLLEKYGAEDKPFQCRYCRAWLTLAVAMIDHMIPLGVGGSAGFENLEAICEDCNLTKGEMLPESFIALNEFLMNLGIRAPKCAQDIHSRLKRCVAMTKERNRLLMKTKDRELVNNPALAAADDEGDF
jgi:5-methylcytosine-specific restriction endonuclease McrA